MRRLFVFLVLWLIAGLACAAPPQPAAPTYSSIVSGSSTAGGHKGDGSINAQTYYKNGNLVPDPLPLAGGTLTGKLTTTPSTNGSAGFNVPPGIVPAAPVDGDMWSTPAGYFVQVNGSTVGPLGIGGGGGGNVSNSGTPAVNQLAQWVSTTAIRGINLNVAVGTALGNPLNASGGLLAFSLIGTSGATIPLLNSSNTWSAIQSYNDGTMVLKGSGSGGSVLHAPATGGGAVQFPAGSVNLGYQVGAVTDQHCLKAFGTAGGFSDAGALCGSGAGGVTQLTGDVTAGPGSGSVVATVVAAPLGGITGMGANVPAALAIPVGTVGAPVVNGGALGTPSSGDGTHLINVPATSLTGVTSVAHGGTGTATPSLIAGTNITLGGTWPNQTINTPLLSTANTWSSVQSFNDTTLVLKGATSGTSVLRAPTTGGGTVLLPATASANMNYQVGAFVDQHCLKAFGTAGGVADAGAVCGSGSGITQLTGGVTAGPGTGSVVATVTSAPLSAITGMGTNVPAALAVNVGTAGSPVVNGGALGTPSSGNGGNLTNIPVAAITGVLPVAKGGSGTAVPSLVGAGTVTISGTWPNQTVASTAGGGTLTSLAAGTPDLIVNSGSCTSGACTVSTQTLLNTQTGSSYAILTTDNTKVVSMTNAAPTTETIAEAGSSGFGVEWGATLLSTLAKTTLTPGGGTLCGQPDMTIGAQTPLAIASDNVSNYVCALGAPPDGVWVSSQRFAYQTPAIATVTFTPTSRGGNNVRINLTSACPCTLANFSGTLVAGQQGMIEVAQDSGGSRTIGTWGSAYVTAGGTSGITLSTGASAVDYLPYAVDSTATKIVLGAIILAPTH